MYAIVECQGFQYRVEPDAVIRIQCVEAEPGSVVTFDRVLLVSDGAATRIGTPILADAAVDLEVLNHGRGPKIRIGKYKRRKDYRRRAGHRQNYTEVKVKAIRG